MRPTLIAGTVLAAAVLSGCGDGPAAAPPPAPGAPVVDGPVGTVVQVTDGDTFVVRLDGRRERVRLLGIDTPEVDGPYTDEECFGPEASGRTRELLPPGTRVTLVGDPRQDARDRNGRLLSYAYRDGFPPSLNERLVAEGYARVYVFGTPFSEVAQFRAAQRAARGAGLGMWGACRR